LSGYTIQIFDVNKVRNFQKKNEHEGHAERKRYHKGPEVLHGKATS